MVMRLIYQVNIWFNEWIYDRCQTWMIYYNFTSDIWLWNDWTQELEMIGFDVYLQKWRRFIDEIYWWDSVNIWVDDHGGIKDLSFGFDSLQSSLLFGGHRESCASRLSKTDLRSQLSRSWVAVPDVVANCDSDSPICVEHAREIVSSDPRGDQEWGSVMLRWSREML